MIRDKAHWYMSIGRRKRARLLQFTCEDYHKCDDLREHLEKYFPRMVFPFGKSEFDLANRDPQHDYMGPFASRSWLGLFRMIGEITSHPTNTMHLEVTPEKRVFHLFFNCHEESVLDALSKPLKQGYFELSYYQNILENLGIPDELEIETHHIVNHGFVKSELNDPNKDEKGPMAYFAFVVQQFEQQGHDIRGQISFSKDPIAMDKIDYTDLQTPSIRNISRPGDELDQIQIRSNIWLKIQDRKNKTDYAYIPIEF